MEIEAALVSRDFPTDEAVNLSEIYRGRRIAFNAHSCLFTLRRGHLGSGSRCFEQRFVHPWKGYLIRFRRIVFRRWKAAEFNFRMGNDSQIILNIIANINTFKRNLFEIELRFERKKCVHDALKF